MLEIVKLMVLASVAFALGAAAMASSLAGGRQKGESCHRIGRNGKPGDK